MKFEEAFAALREGAKIRHPMMESDEYLAACYISIIGMPEDLEEIKKRGISIVKMKGDKEHPDMRPRLPFGTGLSLAEEYPFLKDKIFSPTINLLLLASDEWEILKKKES